MIRLALVLSAVVSAQQAVAPPAIATILDSAGRLTPIFGLAGNFIPGGPGTALLAYSFDGDIEWRLKPGLLSATRAGRTSVYPTDASGAIFRADTAVLTPSRGTIRLEGDLLVSSSDEPNSQLAGRTLVWDNGKLRIFQPDGTVEETACPLQPETMTAAGPDWVHLVIRSRPYLLRVAPGRVGLFSLPLRRPE